MGYERSHYIIAVSSSRVYVLRVRLAYTAACQEV